LEEDFFASLSVFLEKDRDNLWKISFELQYTKIKENNPLNCIREVLKRKRKNNKKKNSVIIVSNISHFTENSPVRVKKPQTVYPALNEAKYLCVIHVCFVFPFSKRSSAYAA
jgi:hypothetical protein